jgi:antitoxin component YwqK of YwqJK toxin-antitoxin module
MPKKTLPDSAPIGRYAFFSPWEISASMKTKKEDRPKSLIRWGSGSHEALDDDDEGLFTDETSHEMELSRNFDDEDATVKTDERSAQKHSELSQDFDDDDETHATVAHRKMERHHHPDGTLLREFQTENGERHGHFREYHPNGQVKSEGTYHRGAMEGRWRFFEENGSLSRELRFKDGQRV